MDTLLYRFDRPDVVSVLEAQTTARGRVDVREARQDGKPIVRVALQPDDVTPISNRCLRPIKVVLTLPLLAVDGAVERFVLDVVGDSSGCELLLEAADARGWGFAYCLGRVDFLGPGSCSADAREPCRYWAARKAPAAPDVVPPIQPHRLVIAMDAAIGGFDFGLCALRVAGQIRLTSPGIA